MTLVAPAISWLVAFHWPFESIQANHSAVFPRSRKLLFEISMAALLRASSHLSQADETRYPKIQLFVSAGTNENSSDDHGSAAERFLASSEIGLLAV